MIAIPGILGEIVQRRLVRIEAPADFVGIETLTFEVADPSGGSNSFDLPVFAASPDGAPPSSACAASS